jgi:hypothetical protein
MLKIFSKLIVIALSTVLALSIATNYLLLENLKKANLDCTKKEWLSCVNKLYLAAKAKNPFNNYSEDALYLGLKIIKSKIDNPITKKDALWKLRQALISTRSWYKPKSYNQLENELNNLLDNNVQPKFIPSPNEPNFFNQFLSQVFYYLDYFYP